MDRHLRVITGESADVISGRLAIWMNDAEVEVGPGHAFVCPPGHDAWVAGDEPCVALDFSGMEQYAKAR